MNVNILENGNLELTLEDSSEFEWLNENINSSHDDLIYSMFERYSCNGSYTYFDADNANPFVGLTEAPCIAEKLDYDDDGRKKIIGKFWYYPDYMIKSFIDELLEDGFVIFELANDE